MNAVINAFFARIASIDRSTFRFPAPVYQIARTKTGGKMHLAEGGRTFCGCKPTSYVEAAKLTKYSAACEKCFPACDFATAAGGK